MAEDGDEEETALMEMSDLKCLETIRTRHSLLNIFKHCYFEIKLHYKKYTVMSFQIMSLQMSVLCQYFTSFASVASWLWLLNISRHDMYLVNLVQFITVQNWNREDASKLPAVKCLNCFFRRGIEVHRKSVMPS